MDNTFSFFDWETGEEIVPQPAPGVDVSKNPPPNISPPQDTSVVNWINGNYPVWVESSNVMSIRYDKENKKLYVVFKGARTYEYSTVPVGIAAGLFCADSVGIYLDRKIKKGGFVGIQVK